MKFYPAILSDSIDEIETQLQVVRTLPQVNVVQIDIIDGLFADNLTLSPSDFLQFDFSNLKIDFHLMVEEPMDYVYEIVDLLENLPVRSIVAQVEKSSYQKDLVQEIKQHQIRAGLSLNIFSQLSAIDPEIYSELDVIQLMAIEAGFQGQSLHQTIYSKIEQLCVTINQFKHKPEIIVDGGVRLTNIVKLKEAGVDSVVIGSMLWTDNNPQQLAKKVASI